MWLSSFYSVFIFSGMKLPTTSDYPIWDKFYDGYRLYVGNLSRFVLQSDIAKEFGRFGVLNDIWVARKPPGFGFVVFNRKRDCEKCQQKLDNRVFFGHSLRVKFAVPCSVKSGQRLPASYQSYVLKLEKNKIEAKRSDDRSYKSKPRSDYHRQYQRSTESRRSDYFIDHHYYCREDEDDSRRRHSRKRHYEDIDSEIDYEKEDYHRNFNSPPESNHCRRHERRRKEDYRLSKPIVEHGGEIQSPDSTHCNNLSDSSGIESDSESSSSSSSEDSSSESSSEPSDTSSDNDSSDGSD